MRRGSLRLAETETVTGVSLANGPAYRAASANPWSIYGFAPGTVDVVAGAFSSITVTAPVSAVSQLQGSSLPVTWTTNQTVTSGEFGIWLVSPANSWYLGKLVPANGASANYVDSVALTMPLDVGYRVFVYCRATPSDPWSIYGFAVGTVDIL